MKKINFTWKDVIYICTIIVGVVLFFRDEAGDKAVLETTVNYNKMEIEEINEKLGRYEEYWLEQKEINGAIINLLRGDSR